MFVDTSALTAMIAGESDASELVARLDQAQTLVTSPIAVCEATVALARLSGKSISDVRGDVERFLELAEIRTLPVPPEIAAIALGAFDRFGKGRHPAKLNMGDCFAYACARHFGEPLLYKGADFPLTDIEAG